MSNRAQQQKERVAMANDTKETRFVQKDKANDTKAIANVTLENTNVTKVMANVSFTNANVTKDNANVTLVIAHVTKDKANETKDDWNVTKDNANYTKDIAFVSLDNAFVQNQVLKPETVTLIFYVIANEALRVKQSASSKQLGDCFAKPRNDGLAGEIASINPAHNAQAVDFAMTGWFERLLREWQTAPGSYSLAMTI